jgi:CxxC motif-containing protein (DUF1111 family)
VKRLVFVLAPLLLCAATPYENIALNGDAFSRPIAGLSDASLQRFRAGSSLFRQAWVIGPSLDHSDVQGLGPLYNRLSCIACHVKNGRGSAPDAESGVARTMAVRLGVAGRNAHGGPLPHPVYGAQLNPEGIPGVNGEGRAVLTYEEFETSLADGAVVSMRRPHLSFRDLAYGPIDGDTKTSVRNAPPVFGLGLLEAVREDDILAFSAQSRGRPNYVFEIETSRRVLGRFGLKANQPNLKQQIANAFVEDVGITSELFPSENCTAAQTACLSAASGASNVELTSAQLSATLDYIRSLAVPARRKLDDPRVPRGEALFSHLGCALCHRETLRLGEFPLVPSLTGASIHPYTDLLLHDMGDELADGREDFEAGSGDWRTPALWGLGLAGRYGDGANYLHDGRARTVTEAILWHGGEAQSAVQAFRTLSKTERDELLAFLESL